jgi:hypothetical protein
LSNIIQPLYSFPTHGRTVRLFRVGEYRMRQTVETPRGRGGALSGSGSGFATTHQTREPRTLPLDASARNTVRYPQAKRRRFWRAVPKCNLCSCTTRAGLSYTKWVSRTKVVPYVPSSLFSTYSWRIGSSWSTRQNFEAAAISKRHQLCREHVNKRRRVMRICEYSKWPQNWTNDSTVYTSQTRE